MPTNRPTWLTRTAVTGLSIAWMLVAFWRGNHLLGLDAGIAYVLVVAGLLWLFVESSRHSGIAAIIRMSILALLAIPIGFALAFPASVNPDVQHFLSDRATERDVRRELKRVFDSDSAFADLSISTIRLKIINVTIQGTLPTRDDMRRLQESLVSDCPTLRQCLLDWDIRLRDTHEGLNGLDRELFPSAETAAAQSGLR